MILACDGGEPRVKSLHVVFFREFKRLFLDGDAARRTEIRRWDILDDDVAVVDAEACRLDGNADDGIKPDGCDARLLSRRTLLIKLDNAFVSEDDGVTDEGEARFDRFILDQVRPVLLRQLFDGNLAVIAGDAVCEIAKETGEIL